MKILCGSRGQQHIMVGLCMLTTACKSPATDLYSVPDSVLKNTKVVLRSWQLNITQCHVDFVMSRQVVQLVNLCIMYVL